MAAERGLAERAEEIAEGLEAEEVHALVGDLEARVLGVAVTLLALAFGVFGGLGVEEGLVLHALNNLFDELLLAFFGKLFVFLLRVFVEELAGVERLADGLAQILHGVRGVVLKLRPGIFEAGVEKEIRQGLHQVFEIEARGEIAGELCIAGKLHAGRGLPCCY